MWEILTPNAVPCSRTAAGVTVAGGCIAIAAWWVLKAPIFPSPLEVLAALPTLWSDGIVWDLLASLTVCFQALLLSAVVGLPISYLSRVPLVAPIASFLSRLRFAGSAVFYLPLLMTTTPHEVKVLLLMLGELFYLVASMSMVVRDIPQEKFDDAYTLKMSEWQTVWYVVIRGTVPQALDALIVNNGMGLSMIMFVEGIVRSEGGVGVRLFEAERYVNYDGFFAIVVLIIVSGIAMDWALRQTRKVVCPYV